MDDFQFNRVLLDISNQLTSEQLDNLKFLCKIGKRALEKIDTGRKLFEALTERNELGPQNTEYLSKRLTEINRHDLAEKLLKFESSHEPTGDQPDDQERVKLDIATEVIVENLGRSWRKLGRKLGLTEVKLESISSKHPTDLEETTVELLKQWRKSQGAEARTEDLIKALRACQLNLTADKVEERLKN